MDFVLDRRQDCALGHVVGSCRACAVAHGIAAALTSGAIKGQCQGIIGVFLLSRYKNIVEQKKLSLRKLVPVC